MKKKLIIACVLTALCGRAFAQSRDIGLQVGINVPVSQTVRIGSDMMLGVSYGQFYYNGLGFRTGVQYAASMASINDVIGVPLAFAYRTRSRSADERFQAGAIGARDAMVYRHPYGSSEKAASFLGGFLLNLFSEAEFFAGVTPGYIIGPSETPSKAVGASRWSDTWVEKKHAFSLSLDAGATLNYSIWRFDLKLTPAIHYNLTNNYIYHLSSGEKGEVVDRTTPLRWFFTLNGGIAFRF
jgi:hypothetical protein